VIPILLIIFCLLIGDRANAQGRSASSPQRGSISAIQWEEFDLLYEDRFFQIANRGLTHVIVELNGYQFRLTTNPSELRRGENVFLIGDTTNIDIRPIMSPTIQNRMRVEARGPAGADADIIVGDSSLIPVVIDTIHFVLNVVPLPQQIELGQNFPNPFNQQTRIVFRIPQSAYDGVDVNIRVYDLLGQRIRTLVNEKRFPGRADVEWNGTNDDGLAVSSGVYIYRMAVGSKAQSRRLLLLK
jgi:hypothetical protein